MRPSSSDSDMIADLVYLLLQFPRGHCGGIVPAFVPVGGIGSARRAERSFDVGYPRIGRDIGCFRASRDTVLVKVQDVGDEEGRGRGRDARERLASETCTATLESPEAKMQGF